MNEKEVLKEKEVAAILGVSVFTLRRWRRDGHGPRYMKFCGAERKNHGPAGAVRYSADELDRFRESITVDPIKKAQK